MEGEGGGGAGKVWDPYCPVYMYLSISFCPMSISLSDYHLWKNQVDRALKIVQGCRQQNYYVFKCIIIYCQIFSTELINLIELLIHGNVLRLIIFNDILI